MPKHKAWSMSRILRVVFEWILGAAGLYYLSAGVWFMSAATTFFGAFLGVVALVPRYGTRSGAGPAQLNLLLVDSPSPLAPVDVEPHSFAAREFVLGTPEYHAHRALLGWH
ncbi:hypothetical protein GQF56_21275 [Rhodobacter sphaeroides]|jgi:hypothetical protein|uniref:hypothetical protein n=1 Tax=Cereibacter sphaeroides TaxID=1063 RepID=UPI0011BEC080|nr:hypothetical protein [Cereibacter sphaeroides]MVX50223.1 hypothetical protein [Cereibacter sphaeroides]MVX50357.1 hypothetical protein [Cereibacter sphaeroides]QJC86836.1 hypothetical protein HGN32_21885 [Cereibacter sphaeroides]